MSGKFEESQSMTCLSRPTELSMMLWSAESKVIVFYIVPTDFIFGQIHGICLVTEAQKELIMLGLASALSGKK